ncbi:MAG: hypothetical protein WDM89_08310 [Rhizomicrobium sp.]
MLRDFLRVEFVHDPHDTSGEIGHRAFAEILSNRDHLHAVLHESAPDVFQRYIITIEARQTVNDDRIEGRWFLQTL